METIAKGNAAEAVVLSAFVERGFRVLVPFGDGHPYDLLVHLPGEVFLRVQCKTAHAKRGTLAFNSRSTDHGHGAGNYDGVADIFGVYFPLNRGVYLLPVEEAPTSRVYLRLEAALNNQRLGIRLAAHYEIDSWTGEALAELAVPGPVVDVA
jgi:hypothetical protein